MRNYNTILFNLREKEKLSLKDAAKKIGISTWKLYLYENGYFRPSHKNLKKIEAFYNTTISFEGENAYPAPTKEKKEKAKKPYFKRRIVFGALSAFSLISVIVGSVLFNSSINNANRFYGNSFNEIRQKVLDEGNIGHDLVTSLEYHYSDRRDLGGTATIIFYEVDSLLYFNECTYSSSYFEKEGPTRYHFHFGSNLGVPSNECNFTYGVALGDTFFRCSFDYEGKEIDKVYNFEKLIETDTEIDESFAVEKINARLNEMELQFSRLCSELAGKNVSFNDDFLREREMERVVNYALQIAGLVLILPGIFAFFIFISIFLRFLIINIKPRLVTSEPKEEMQKNSPLPKDLRINFGIPDNIVILIAKIFQYGAIFFLILAFLGKLGVSFFTFLTHPVAAAFLKAALPAGIFLEHFVMIGRIKKATTLFQAIIYNLGVFFFIATIETALIVITNAWGYDFASLIINYVPGNVFQVIAIHYLIFLFLFFQPSFLNQRGKLARILWHSLSIIPLIFLIASYFISNAYALTYGVEENIFINFWFPNGFLSLSVVSVLFMYITFAIRLLYERKYGQSKSQIFFYGDRYTLYENAICSILILAVALLDLLFINNQKGYYLGLGNNLWILALIPFIILCKYSPNNQQLVILSEQLELPSRNQN